MKRCNACGETKPEEDFAPYYKDDLARRGRQGRCRPCVALAYACRKYGITVERYWRMWHAQAGKCAICEQPDRTGRMLAIDHDHVTLAVRALLCHGCNLGLGHFQDSEGRLLRAAEYILAHKDVAPQDRLDRACTPADLEG